MEPTKPSKHELAILKATSELEGCGVDSVVHSAYFRGGTTLNMGDMYAAYNLAKAYELINAEALDKYPYTTKVRLTDKGREVLNQLGA